MEPIQLLPWPGLWQIYTHYGIPHINASLLCLGSTGELERVLAERHLPQPLLLHQLRGQVRQLPRVSAGDPSNSINIHPIEGAKLV